MGLDFIDTVDPEAVLCICHEAHDEVSGGWREVGFGGDDEGLAPVDNLLAGGGGVVREEGRVSDEHFEEDGSERPPVSSFVVAGFSKHFWSDVVGSSDG